MEQIPGNEDESGKVSPRPEPVEDWTKPVVRPGAKDAVQRFMFYGVLAILAGIIISIAIPQQLGSRRGAWASRAKGTLRSIGSSELAYQSSNRDKRFGSFQALVKSGDVASGYTLGNMIENYSLTWETTNLSTAQGETSGYVVVAWPRDRRKDFLNTFAITEDQAVRVYDPDPAKPSIRLSDVKSWDPIL